MSGSDSFDKHHPPRLSHQLHANMTSQPSNSGQAPVMHNVSMFQIQDPQTPR